MVVWQRLIVFAVCFLFFAATEETAFAGTFLTKETKLVDLGVRDDSPTNARGQILIGDMIFKKQRVGILGAVASNRWTNGTLVYRFSSALTFDQRVRFQNACNAWIGNSALRCLERTTQSNYVYVKTHNGNQCAGVDTSCSEVGMVGNAQDLWIYVNSWTSDYILQHEIGHALGMVHEHQRPDRDNYILIIENNIGSGGEGQFDVFGGSLFTATDYDFYSIMHYGNCFFTIYQNLCTDTADQYQTIQAQSCDIDAVGGSTISALDHQAIDRAYSGSFSSLFAENRNPRCVGVRYNNKQWQQVCQDGSCKVTGAVSWRKIVTRYYSACGFISAGKERAMCGQIKREYIDSWTDSDSFSCGHLSLDTLNEIWSMCGCSYLVGNSLCSNFNEPVYASYNDGAGKVNWRQSRALYFLDVFNAMSVDGAIADEVGEGMEQFIQKNYFDPRFETKMASLRAGMYSYSKWRKGLEPDFKLSKEFFNISAVNRKLRPL
jgi:Astacin (Peptidase family M12A)